VQYSYVLCPTSGKFIYTLHLTWRPPAGRELPPTLVHRELPPALVHRELPPASGHVTVSRCGPPPISGPTGAKPMVAHRPLCAGVDEDEPATAHRVLTAAIARAGELSSART